MYTTVIDGKEITLEFGDLVETRDGKILILLQNRLDTKTGYGFYSRRTQGCQSYLSQYNKNLYHDNYSELDIMKIYKTSKHKNDSTSFGQWNILSGVIFEKEDDIVQGIVNSIKWDWKREEVKEMTIADVEKLVGCKVKIVKSISDN